MLLRSSSTPVLGSLLQSFAESPNNIMTIYNNSNNNNNSHNSPNNKFGFLQNGYLNLSSVSSNSSPIDSQVKKNCLERTQSEGNLEGLLGYELPVTKMFPRRPKCLMLQTIPSFSFRNSNGKNEYEDDDDDDEREELEEDVDEREMKSNGLGLENVMMMMNFNEDDMTSMDKIWSMSSFEQENERRVSHKMRVVEVGGGGGRGGGNGNGGGNGDFSPYGSGGNEWDKQGFEEYYKKLVEENPGNPLFLRNYAQFLYEAKRDLKGAEEYYSRAILADPKEGDMLSQYAKIVWELHHDQERAASYFERAIQVSPKDSHVQAAYANFLWETEDDEDEEDDDDMAGELRAMTANIRQGTIASA
ncbi:uncharacterized protein LOC115715066 [Cannabis sativa]|uniref:TmcB/TmcC TPR repeats domain-containing protein n=1 Tax=Cannabis sativa TaxID=3483 RepID=A0A7J6GVT0_CANSA|nr:uncharacterized protein LOC115715066 [Cannabis sativa]KAF4387036.1 hypothetical protein G4B88_024608 [Cannabis sativa]